MFQLYRNHSLLSSDTSDTSSYGLSNTMENSKNILYSTASLPHTLDDLLAGMKVPPKEARQPPPARSKCSTRKESVLINLDVSDGETSISDSGSESPVYVQLPPEPVIQEHTVSAINAKVSWASPQNGELISFYELHLQEAKLEGQGKDIHWFCSQTEENLENLTPGTTYVIRARALNVAGTGKWSPPYRFCTVYPIPGMPLDPSPVTVTVRRHRKSQKKTIFIPSP
ncbi:fibronectin type III domain-containing protein 8 [Thamnophis elegans]|uniref:fibronectin type III domain-containing protein 8 n=1 Tax=Thamnophis elegans TaxID=35005 RepID=UPI00137849D3|nr:fibronectin type III domain-containing protein 8 [Thamnophis elegans]